MSGITPLPGPFRSWVQSPGTPWPEHCVQEWMLHARAMVVRVVGVWARYQAISFYGAAGRELIDAPLVRNWERAMRYTVPPPSGGNMGGRRIAPVISQALYLPGTRGRPVRIGPHTMFAIMWCDRNARMIDRLLRGLAQQTGLPVHVCAEDFACRWVLGSRFVPASLVLDTPIVATDELRTIWSHQLEVPTYVRVSQAPWLRHWNSWRIPFRPEDLFCHHRRASRSVIGHWNAPAKKGQRQLRPLREWLAPTGA